MKRKWMTDLVMVMVMVVFVLVWGHEQTEGKLEPMAGLKVVERAREGDRPAPQFLGIGGLHHSGTTLMAMLLAAHPDAAGMEGTKAPANEGQHVQSVFPTVKELKAVSRELAAQYPQLRLDEWRADSMHFVHRAEAHLTEESRLASGRLGERLWQQWQPYWNTSKQVVIEKSPPNLVRARLLQALLSEHQPMFLFTLRHPLAIWTGHAGPAIIEQPRWLRQHLQHYLLAHRLLQEDLARLSLAVVLRFEDFVSQPRDMWFRLLHHLGLRLVPLPFQLSSQVSKFRRGRWGFEASAGRQGPEINPQHRHDWIPVWESLLAAAAEASAIQAVLSEFEPQINYYGYSLFPPYFLDHAPFFQS